MSSNNLFSIIWCGHLCLIDYDKVSESNLNRQVLFSEDISLKSHSSKNKLNSLNSKIDIKAVPEKVDAKFNRSFLKNYDYIIDCTDNFQSRTLINSISIDYKIPLKLSRNKFEGQVATFRNDIDNTPCYRCLYQDLPDISPSCLDSEFLEV